MKTQFSLILGSALFLSQLTPGVAVEPGMYLEQDYAENIRRTAIAILDIPPEQQTFENTLRPWNHLGAQVSQISEDLYAYWLEAAQNPELRQVLMNGAFGKDRYPFQRYLGAKFIEGGSSEPVYLPGELEEQDNFATDFTVLNLKSEAPSENAGVVCIQEIATDDHAYELYEAMKGNYAHFIYVPPATGLNSGMLIASKYRMDEEEAIPLVLFENLNTLRRAQSSRRIFRYTVAPGTFEILPIKSRRDRDDSGAGGKCEGGITGSWGDGKGIQWEGYVKAEAYDGKGNYVEAEVTQKDDGKGDVDIHGGHETQKR